MTRTTNGYPAIARAEVILLLVCLHTPLVAGVAQEKDAPGSSAYSQQILKEFDSRIKAYIKLRKEMAEKLPKLSKEAKPEEIETHKTTFQGTVRTARAHAKPGDIFTADVAKVIRTTTKREFKGKDLQQVREAILEAETKGVPVRVNYPYPETKEYAQIPPTLLLILPPLPQELKYRFVGRHMLLVDRENGLIIDYMLDALP